MTDKLLVASVVDPVCAKEAKTQAVTAILEHHGFDYRPIVDEGWFGWPSKLLGQIKLVHDLAISKEYTHLMFIDARDIVLLDGPGEVMKRYYEFDHPWVYNAEPFIWSPDSFQPEDYPTPKCIYRYVNGGASVGLISHMNRYYNKWTKFGADPPVNLPRGDQDWIAARFIEDYPDAIMLDHNCELFQCMCGSLMPAGPNCMLLQGKVINHITKTNPIVIHFNGGDDITSPERRMLWDHWI